MKSLLIPVVGLCLVSGCSHSTTPSEGQGAVISHGMTGDPADEGTKMDGVRRIRSGISNADDELQHNPTMERREQLENYKQHAYKDACNLWKQVDPHDLDADLLQWGKSTCE